MRTLVFLLLAQLCCAPAAFSSDEYTQSIEQWREKRLESLKKPEGWFSYAGFRHRQSGYQHGRQRQRQ